MDKNRNNEQNVRNAQDNRDQNIRNTRNDQNVRNAQNCVFRRHPDSDFGNIRTAYRNYPDSVSETSGHLAWLTN